MNTRLNVINIDPEIVSGTPVFMGTRVPIKNLFDWLTVDTLESFFENFPSVERRQVYELLGLAREAVIEKAYRELENEMPLAA